MAEGRETDGSAPRAGPRSRSATMEHPSALCGLIIPGWTGTTRSSSLRRGGFRVSRTENWTATAPWLVMSLASSPTGSGLIQSASGASPASRALAQTNDDRCFGAGMPWWPRQGRIDNMPFLADPSSRCRTSDPTNQSVDASAARGPGSAGHRGGHCAYRRHSTQLPEGASTSPGADEGLLVPLCSGRSFGCGGVPWT